MSEPALSASAVRSVAVTEGWQAIWHEWLTRYFDGAEHAVQGEMVAFPRIGVGFAGAATDEEHERDGVWVMVHGEMVQQRTFLAGGAAIPGTDQGRLKDVHGVMRWRFLVRSVKGTAARYWSRHAAELLMAALRDPELTLGLARCGVMDVRPEKGRWLAGDRYETREVRVMGEVQYVVKG